MLAALETGVTFCVSYRASVVLGTVLLQTAPERRLSGGRMEAFLRAMRDVSWLFLTFYLFLLSAFCLLRSISAFN